MKKEQTVGTAMKKAGYTSSKTGGDFSAYIKEYGQYEIWVTKECKMPRKFIDTIDVGLYKDEGQTNVGELKLESVDELLKMDERVLVNKKNEVKWFKANRDNDKCKGMITRIS